jgi:hypothetical protein
MGPVGYDESNVQFAECIYDFSSQKIIYKDMRNMYKDLVLHENTRNV